MLMFVFLFLQKWEAIESVSTACLKADMEHPLLREFEPLTNLLARVPCHIQKGLLTCDLMWTCVDVTDHWVAIGTDAGLVYLYHRPSETVVHQLTSQVAKVCTFIVILLKPK